MKFRRIIECGNMKEGRLKNRIKVFRRPFGVINISPSLHPPAKPKHQSRLAG
ncbi:hypothetical protein [Neisseria sicca]|uniref:hypothetical protein n=1 Tax=Neisseria sicca TaxID=490 RepID=UPI001649AF6B|nr:hypothetical protein [Neisseria sicca]